MKKVAEHSDKELVQAPAGDREQGQVCPWAAAAPLSSGRSPYPFFIDTIPRGQKVKRSVIQRYGGGKCAFSEWERRVNFVPFPPKTTTNCQILTVESQSSVVSVPRR